MKLGLINSAWAQAGRDTAFGIRMTKEIGFDTIDIFADPLDLDARERRLIRRECERAGLPIVSLACVAVGLIDFNPPASSASTSSAAAATSTWPTSTTPGTSCSSWANTSGSAR
jgi:sugar phosphate isomerase/epimerase